MLCIMDSCPAAGNGIWQQTGCKVLIAKFEKIHFLEQRINYVTVDIFKHGQSQIVGQASLCNVISTAHCSHTFFWTPKSEDWRMFGCQDTVHRPIYLVAHGQTAAALSTGSPDHSVPSSKSGSKRNFRMTQPFLTEEKKCSVPFAGLQWLCLGNHAWPLTQKQIWPRMWVKVDKYSSLMHCIKTIDCFTTAFTWSGCQNSNLNTCFLHDWSWISPWTK